MYLYGFEWEVFYCDPMTKIITLPPLNLPHDGMPGIVEFRSYGGRPSLDHALADIYAVVLTNSLDFNCFSTKVRHKFSPEEKRALRKRGWLKEDVDIQNLYGKAPRDLKGWDIISLQINISNESNPAYTDCKGISHLAQYTLLDIPRIVRALDKEFASEIKASGRQLGEYCVKGVRLEYRSLPSSSFPEWHPNEINKFLSRVKKAVEGE